MEERGSHHQEVSSSSSSWDGLGISEAARARERAGGVPSRVDPEEPMTRRQAVEAYMAKSSQAAGSSGREHEVFLAEVQRSDLTNAEIGLGRTSPAFAVTRWSGASMVSASRGDVEDDVRAELYREYDREDRGPIPEDRVAPFSMIIDRWGKGSNAQDTHGR